VSTVVLQVLEESIYLHVMKGISAYINKVVGEDESRELRSRMVALFPKPQAFYLISEEIISTDDWSVAVLELQEMDRCVTPTQKLQALLLSAKAIFNTVCVCVCVCV
jgi:hypothetical protein